MSNGVFSYLLEVQQLEAVVAHAPIRVEKKFFTKRIVDQYKGFLDKSAKSNIRFTGSAGIFHLVFSYLEEEFNMELKCSSYKKFSEEIVSKRSNSTHIFTFEQKVRYLDLLSKTTFSEPKLWSFNKEYFSDDDTNLPELEIAAIRFLSKTLEMIPDEQYVSLLSIE